MAKREKVIRSKHIFDGQIVKLHVDTVLTPDGQESTREIVEHAPAILVAAIDENDNVLMVQQYRRATGKELLELPAGGVEPNETPEAATIREMQEETGYMPGRVVRLGGFYTAPGFCSEFIHMFVSTDLKPSRLFAEDTDEIKLIRVPVKDVPALLTSGKLEDAKTYAGLYMYLAWRKKT
jgi:ADP-ribose pyrophosphatase